MENNRSKLSYLLGEMRRQMNGAVASSMRFYGADYGLNYGVSLPTIRSIAQTECVEKDYKFAKLLYLQQVRELRLASLWYADTKDVEADGELMFWSSGIVNSEIAEEAAFVLFCRCNPTIVAEGLLFGHGEIKHYSAVLTLTNIISGNGNQHLTDEQQERYTQRIKSLLNQEMMILPKAAVVYLEVAWRKAIMTKEEVTAFIDCLPQHLSSIKYIREEMQWRVIDAEE